MELDKLKTHTPTNKGFTLIELMVVIAIIGILAAIAIPNFISYRNKAFCSKTESDALSITGAIADYFAIPVHTSIATTDFPTNLISDGNTFTITTTDPNVNITITVTDSSGRCPPEYQANQNAALNPEAYWQANVYYKLISI